MERCSLIRIIIQSSSIDINSQLTLEWTSVNTRVNEHEFFIILSSWWDFLAALRIVDLSKNFLTFLAFQRYAIRYEMCFGDVLCLMAVLRLLQTI